ncbi:hypothetical protein [Bradyrhizobium sp.]|uniref:hypothetical protein n=1 Tax=Bradyrhizobium sp. TaxID=376 RepID=UPI0025C364D5|nr:hypothetical protein [Bradyrhizobium sp.]MBV8923130.1 hypothetical protein [Bradyrhizobium sp.]
MEKKIAGVLGAVAALSTLTAAQAAPTDVLRANSYAELLNPIPDAAAQLKVLNEREASQPAEQEKTLRLAYHHHHHHHHHRAYFRSRVIVVPHRHYHHHHHHHHHHHYHHHHHHHY